MQIFVPGKKKRRFAAAYVLAALLVLGAAGVAAFFSARVYRWQPPPAQAPAPADPEERRLEGEMKRFESEVDHITESLYLAEEFRDRKKYMELVEAAAGKNLEADRLWLELQKRAAEKRGLYEGMQQSFFEGWPNRFSDDEKIAMIAERHGMTPETVRKLKSQIEVVFADEYLDKFGSAETAEPAAEERATRGAPS